MSRPKGRKNKSKPVLVESFGYTTEQRIDLLAALIVERILEDTRNGRNLIALLGPDNAAN